MQGIREVKNSTETVATISVKDGRTQKLDQFISITEKEQINLKLLPNKLIEVEYVKSITINGIEFDM